MARRAVAGLSSETPVPAPSRLRSAAVLVPTAAGPKDFAVGVKVGTVSLMSNVTGGMLDTAAKFTGSIGKGLAQASMDKKYQAQREGLSACGGTLRARAPNPPG